MSGAPIKARVMGETMLTEYRDLRVGQVFQAVHAASGTVVHPHTMLPSEFDVWGRVDEPPQFNVWVGKGYAVNVTAGNLRDLLH